MEELLDRVCEGTTNGDRVSLEEVLETIGSRSFGPLLLLAGLVTVMPILGDIPGVPTVMAFIVLLVAGQLLIGRKHLWLPQWLLHRTVKRDTLRTSVGWMYRPARFVDRWLQPRFRVLTHKVASYAIAAACIVIALTMPALEFIPFSANLAGAALTAFGLSLIVHDGLLALFAFGFTAATIGVAVYSLV